MLTLMALIGLLVSVWAWRTLDDETNPLPMIFATLTAILILTVGVMVCVWGGFVQSFDYQEGQVEIAKEKLDSLAPVYAKAQVEAVETELVAYRLARPSFGTSYPAIGVAETIKWYAREVAKLQRDYLNSKSDLNELYRDTDAMGWLIVPWSVVIW